MVTRRDVGLLFVGAGVAGGGGWLATSGELQSVADPMRQTFPTSSEFAAIEWGRDGWVTIETSTDAAGQSIALAPGRVDDPLSVDHVGSNITERGAVVEFGLKTVIQNRDFESVTIGSYRIDDGGGVEQSAEVVDVVTVTVPDPVLAAHQ